MIILSDVIHFHQFFVLDANSAVAQMNLISVLSHSLKCQTCLLWRDAPAGVAPIFPANECANEHIANNHIIICLVGQSKNFQGTWCKDMAIAHISDCIVKATYNTSKPFICMSLSSNIMAEISSKYDLSPMLTKYKRMYFMSYRFIFMFSATFTEQHIFPKLMYRAINQQDYKYKLLRFPLNCHLEKELKPILNELYQKNTDLEVSNHKLTWLGFLKGMSLSINKYCHLWSSTYQRRRKMGLLWCLHWQDTCILSYIQIWLIPDIHKNNYYCDFQQDTLSIM